MGLATPPNRNTLATETKAREDVNRARNEEPQTLGMMMDGSQNQPGAGILKTKFYGLRCRQRWRGLSISKQVQMYKSE